MGLDYFGLRISDCGFKKIRSQPFDKLRAGSQNPGERQSKALEDLNGLNGLNDFNDFNDLNEEHYAKR